MAKRTHSSGLLVILVLGSICATYLTGRILLRWSGEEAPEAERGPAHAVLPARSADARRRPARPPGAPGVGASASPGAPQGAREEAPPPAPDAPSPEVAAVLPKPPEGQSFAPAADLTARRLEGRLLFPGSFPPDEELFVQLLSPADAAAALQGGPARAAPGGVRVASDGLFTLELPPGSGKGFLDVRGRYHFLDRPVEIPARLPSDPVEVRVQLGSWVRGAVVPPGVDASPAAGPAGADVFLTPDFGATDATASFDGFEGPTVRRAVTDAEGRFEFRGVPAGRPWRVAALVRGFLPARSETVRPPAGLRTEVDLQLEPGARVTGRVLDELGQGVEGARVRAHPERIERSLDPALEPLLGELFETTTDAEGTFVLRGLPPGTYTLLPSHPARYAASGVRVELRARRARDAVVLALPAGEAIAGRVRWSDGEAPSGAVVVAVPERAGAPESPRVRRGAERSTPIDGHGTFRLAGLAPGAYTLLVESERRTTFGELERSSTVRRGVLAGGADVELVLEPHLPLRGQVLDEEGRPLQAFDLVADPLPGSEGDRDQPRTGFEHRIEEKDGRFRLQAFARGAWELSVRAPGFTPSEPRRVVLPEDASQALEFRLSPAAALAGRVIDPDGRPVAGARVRVSSPSGRPRELSCDLSGRFVASGLPPGTWRAVAEAPGLVACEPRTLDLSPGRTGEPLDLLLRTGGTLLGRVAGDAAGGEAPAQLVTAALADPPLRRTARTDAEGRFRLDHLHPGTWRLWSSPLSPGAGGQALFGDLTASEVVVQDGDVASVALGAGEAGRPIRGTLRVDGAPAPGLLLFVPEGKLPLAGRRIVEADAQGRFADELDGPGRYLVTAVPSGARGQESGLERVVRVPAGVAPWELDLAFVTGRIGGRVLAPDGTPLPGVEISLAGWGPLSNATALGGTLATDTTGSDGCFVFPFLPEGRFALSVGTTVWVDEDAPLVLGRRVLGDLQVEAGRALPELSFQLREGGELVGRVVGADGRRVAGAALYLRAADGALLDRFSSVRSDATGRFRFESLEPGTYGLFARKDDLVSEEAAGLLVVERKKFEQTLVVRPGASLRISVQDGEGGGVAARILVQDAAGRQVNGSADAQRLAALRDGGFDPEEQVVGPLVPGSYRVTALGEAGERTERTVELADTESRKVILRFGEG